MKFAITSCAAPQFHHRRNQRMSPPRPLAGWDAMISRSRQRTVDREDDRMDWDDVDWPVDDDQPDEPSEGVAAVFSVLREDSDPDRQLTSAVGLSRGIIRHAIGFMSRETREAMLRESEETGRSLPDLLTAWLAGTWTGGVPC